MLFFDRNVVINGSSSSNNISNTKTWFRNIDFCNVELVNWKVLFNHSNKTKLNKTEFTIKSMHL